MSLQQEDATKEWEILAEKVRLNCERFLKVLREAGAADYDETADGIYASIRHRRWLIPLAEALAREPALQSLYPLQHHGVLELKRFPDRVQPQKDIFTIFAEGEGLFKAYDAAYSVEKETRHSTLLGMSNTKWLIKTATRFVEAGAT